MIKANIFAKYKVELRIMAYTNTQKNFERLKIARGYDIGMNILIIEVFISIKIKLTKGIKYEAPKIKKSKKINSKNKDSKKKSKKNLPPTLEEILEEFVKNKMIKKSTFTKFDEFLGEVSYSANVLRGESHYYDDPPYSLGDLRQVRP